MLSSSRVFYASLLIFTIQCRPAANASDSKVVGGREDYTAHPAAIGLNVYLENGKEGTCTGTVINDELVMTAAHCLAPPGAGRVTKIVIYIRERDLTSPPTQGPKSLSSSDFISHPSYVPLDPEGKNLIDALKYDIGFIRFTKGALREYAKANISKFSPKVGDNVTFVGYGLDQVGNSGHTGKRHVGQNKIDEIGTDSQGSAISVVSQPTYDKNGKVIQFPAILNGGDSGGPLFDAQGNVIGIASKANAKSGDYAVYFALYTSLFHPKVAAFVKQHVANAPVQASSLSFSRP